MKLIILLVGVFMFSTNSNASFYCSGNGYTYSAPQEDDEIARNVNEKCQKHVKEVLFNKISKEEKPWKYFSMGETSFEIMVLDQVIPEKEQMDLFGNNIDDNFKYAQEKGYFNSKYYELKDKYVNEKSLFKANIYCCQNLERLIKKVKSKIKK